MCNAEEILDEDYTWCGEENWWWKKPGKVRPILEEGWLKEILRKL